MTEFPNGADRWPWRKTPMHQKEQNTNRQTISTRSEEYEMCETIEKMDLYKYRLP